MRPRALPIVMCPGCQVEMTFLSAQDVRGGSQLEEITYRCPKCGTETARPMAGRGGRNAANTASSLGRHVARRQKT